NENVLAQQIGMAKARFAFERRQRRREQPFETFLSRGRHEVIERRKVGTELRNVLVKAFVEAPRLAADSNRVQRAQKRAHRACDGRDEIRLRSELVERCSFE